MRKEQKQRQMEWADVFACLQSVVEADRDGQGDSLASRPMIDRQTDRQEDRRADRQVQSSK